MLTATVEQLLNRGLPRSPRAQKLCAELAGSRIAIEIQGFASVIVASDGVGLTLTTAPSPDVPTRISGSPLGLWSLMGGDASANIQRGAARITGDVELAQKFRELAGLLRPDLEEELALAIGDVPAHRIVRLTRGVIDWGRRAADTAARNIAEYLAHERGDLVSQPEGRQLLEGIDVLRDDVERLEARLELLAQRVGAARRAQPRA
jgi:ubiquinone biosynthesis protein UbiJ